MDQRARDVIAMGDSPFAKKRGQAALRESIKGIQYQKGSSDWLCSAKIAFQLGRL
jgi:hypothetical protein